jgi:hypothetical protein
MTHEVIMANIYDYLSAAEHISRELYKADDQAKILHSANSALEAARAYELKIPALQMENFYDDPSVAERVSRELYKVDEQAQILHSLNSAFETVRAYELEIPALADTLFRHLTQIDLTGALWGKIPDLTADARTALLIAAKSLREPWVDITNPLESARGLASLMDVGKSLQEYPFDTSVSEALRHQLGDWRILPNIPNHLAEDSLYRRTTYYENGLNTSLNALPTSSFGEILEAAHIVAPAALQGPRKGISGKAQNQKLDSLRSPDHRFPEMVMAYEICHILEKNMRKFITVVLVGDGGATWIKRHVPPDIQADWAKRMEAAEQDGENRKDLIEFAELGDYPKIICRKDNWKLFENVFRRKESVQESFNRLIPLRRIVAHHRELNKEDILLLLVEVQRLCKAMTSRVEGLLELPFLTVFDF